MRYIVRKISFLFLFLFGILPGINAQTNKIDIFRELYEKASSNKEKIQAALNMCDQYFSLTPDSLLRYVNIGKKLTDPGSDDHIRFQNYYCSYLFKTGLNLQSRALSDSLFEITKFRVVQNAAKMEIIAMRCSGLIRNGENKEAIEQSFILLQSAERIKDTFSVIKAYTLLGWANLELDQNKEGIKWMNKGFHYSANPAVIERAYNLFSNIAACYDNVDMEDSAFYFVNLALKYSKLEDNLASYANALNIRASMYIKTKRNNAAEKDMQEAIRIRQTIGDILYVTSDMAGLSYFYASTGQTNKGISIAKEGIAIAEKSSNISKLIFLYSSLAENYKQANELDKYNASLETIIRLKDSLYKKNSGNAIAEMEGKYNLQKQRNIIITQEYALARSRYLVTTSVIVFLFGLLLTLAWYRNYKSRQKRRMQAALAEQKMISFKTVEIAKENERKRIAADLHDNLGSYAAAITANVKNLKEEMKPALESIMSQLDENAQSMVTQLGDTIWVLKNEQLPITKLADRFKSWVLRIMQNYPNMKYHYAENIVDDIEFTPSKILHIFLILKECVTNALKHSNGTELQISFFSEGHWTILIEDNGTGFNINTVTAGSGIGNIKVRAAECGWAVKWKNTHPHGTSISICQVLLQNEYF